MQWRRQKLCYYSEGVFSSGVWAKLAGSVRDASLKQLTSRFKSSLIASKAAGTTFRREFCQFVWHNTITKKGGDEDWKCALATLAPSPFSDESWAEKTNYALASTLTEYPVN